jgi:hypothetical protein
LNYNILSTEAQAFINTYLNTDINTLLLKGTSLTDVSTPELCEQIEAKKRCLKKLPTWYKNKNIYYPNKLNIEQTSSEKTAAYKAQLIDGDSIIDITGGFGVDCFYFAKHFTHVTHCDIDTKLSQLVAHNYNQLGLSNIDTINTDGLAYLKDTEAHFDWIYVDPSRRHADKGKVFFLKDCLPNIPEHLTLLFSRAKRLLIKTAPLLDISVGLQELTHVKTIHIVALHNEVKELLWVLEQGYTGQVAIKTVNLQTNGNVVFNTKYNATPLEFTNYSLPLQFLYEPNAAILKSGAFNAVALHYKCAKLHQHSHLYTTDTLIDFPGRRFKIETQCIYSKKNMKQLGIHKANITTRNFPISVTDLRKKHKITDGGAVYLFFTTAYNNNKYLLVCSKV